ncbi:MAG: type II secretion system protein GspN [Pseudomonadota bacterium]|nr:MAG: type II secretion system protein GspN [Pseudomonadota bacterium]
MRKLVWLVVLAIPLIVALTLPARVALWWFDPPEEIGDVRGTIWRGQALWRQPGQAPLDLTWRWRSGLSWHWRVSQVRGGSTVLNGIGRPVSGGLALEDVSGRLDVTRADIQLWMMNTRARGYLEFDIERAVMVDGQPPEIAGQIVWREAALEGTVHESLGEILVDLTPGRQRQQARVESLQPAPVTVRGTIDLEVDQYTVDLWLRASPDRPDLDRQLAWMGERQSDGQIRIRLSGALGW